MDREKKEYETCEADKRDLENGVSRLKWEKESMEEEEKKLSAHVTDLNKLVNLIIITIVVEINKLYEIISAAE